jgi:O-acetyl-ADP-ribose deacetylase (regulator of RNase III)
LRDVAGIKLPNGHQLIAAAGSVLDFRGDAIVNAANEGCVSGGGVDGAINSVAGPALIAARKKLNGCPTGQAKSTDAFGLTPGIKRIVHAVGPAYRVPWGGKVDSWADKDELLVSAYQCALREAMAGGASSIAFSLLSAGVFRGSRPLKDVLLIGTDALLDAMRALPARGLTRPGEGSAGDARSAALAESAAAAAADLRASDASSAGAGEATNGSGTSTSALPGEPLEVYMVAYTTEERETLAEVFKGVGADTESGTLSCRPHQRKHTKAMLLAKVPGSVWSCRFFFFRFRHDGAQI